MRVPDHGRAWRLDGRAQDGHGRQRPARPDVACAGKRVARHVDERAGVDAQRRLVAGRIAVAAAAVAGGGGSGGGGGHLPVGQPERDRVGRFIRGRAVRRLHYRRPGKPDGRRRAQGRAAYRDARRVGAAKQDVLVECDGKRAGGHVQDCPVRDNAGRGVVGAHQEGRARDRLELHRRRVGYGCGGTNVEQGGKGGRADGPHGCGLCVGRERDGYGVRVRARRGGKGSRPRPCRRAGQGHGRRRCAWPDPPHGHGRRIRARGRDVLVEPQRQHAGSQVKDGRLRAGAQQRRGAVVSRDGRGQVDPVRMVAEQVVDGAGRRGEFKAARRGMGQRSRGLLRARQAQLYPVRGLSARRQQQVRACQAVLQGIRAGRRQAHVRYGGTGGIDVFVKPQDDVAVAQVDRCACRDGAGRVAGVHERDAHEPLNAVAGKVGQRAGRQVGKAHRPLVAEYGRVLRRRRVDNDPVRVRAGQAGAGIGPVRHGRRVGAGKGRHACGVGALDGHARREHGRRVGKLVQAERQRSRCQVEHRQRLQLRPCRVGKDHEGGGRRGRRQRVAGKIRERARRGGQGQAGSRRRYRGKGPRLLRVREPDYGRVGAVRSGRQAGGGRASAGKGQGPARRGGAAAAAGRHKGQPRHVGRAGIDVLAEPHGQRAGPHVKDGRARRVERGRDAVGYDGQAGRRSCAAAPARNRIAGQVGHGAVRDYEQGRVGKPDQGRRLDCGGQGRGLAGRQADANRVGVCRLRRDKPGRIAEPHAVPAVAVARAVDYGHVDQRQVRGAGVDVLVKVDLESPLAEVHDRRGRRVNGRGAVVGDDRQARALDGGRRVAGQVVERAGCDRYAGITRGVAGGKRRLLGVRELYNDDGGRAAASGRSRTAAGKGGGRAAVHAAVTSGKPQ